MHRTRRTAIGLSALTIGILLAAAQAPAGALTSDAKTAAPALEFEFSSTVDASAIGGDASTPIRIIYRFSPTMPLLTSTGTSSTYGPLERVIIDVGNHAECLALPGADAARSEIIVTDNPAGSADADVYTVDHAVRTDDVVSLLGRRLLTAQIHLIDVGSTMFADTSLPTTPGFAPGVAVAQTVISLTDGTTQTQLVTSDQPYEFHAYLSPKSGVITLQTFVRSLGLSAGITTAILQPLQKATDYLAAGDGAKAIKALEEFKTQVTALTDRGIPLREAQKLLIRATAAIDNIPPCS